MVKVALFLAFLSVFCLKAGSQDHVDPAIKELSWNEFYRVQWEDFQGQPDKNSLGDAATAVQIRARPFLIRKEIHYDVVAIFNRSKSWVRDKSPSLLAHEQLHFDLAELYARKIRKRIKELNDRGVDDIKTFNNAIHQLLQESNQIDLRYDVETLHGALDKKQAAWSKKIKEELASLKNFQKTKRVIGG